MPGIAGLVIYPYVAVLGCTFALPPRRYAMMLTLVVLCHTLVTDGRLIARLLSSEGRDARIYLAGKAAGLSIVGLLLYGLANLLALPAPIYRDAPIPMPPLHIQTLWFEP